MTNSDCLSAIAIAVILTTNSVAADLEVVALTGTPIIGSPGESFQYPVGAIAINSQGDVALLGDTNVEFSRRQGVFLYSEGELSRIARRGDAAPGISNKVYDNFLLSGIDDAGRIGFLSRVRVPRQVDRQEVLYLIGSDGEARIVAAEGQRFPDEGPIVRSLSHPSSINGQGEFAYSGFVPNVAVNNISSRFLYTEGGGDARFLGRQNRSLNGFDNVLVDVFRGPYLNRLGQTAISASLLDDRDSTVPSWAILVAEPLDRFEFAVRTGDPVPQLPDLTVGRLFNFALGADGQLAFLTNLNGPGVNPQNEQALILRDGPEDSWLVARRGMPLPELGIETNLGTIDLNFLSLGANGHIGFSAQLTGASVDAFNDSALFLSGYGGGVELIAREGDLIPDSSDGERFSDFGEIRGGVPAVNALGQAAVLTDLLTPSGDLIQGLFAQDLSGELRLLTKVGALLDVAGEGMPADLREVRALGFRNGSGNGDGRISGFNDRGELAFVAGFTDGSSGVFLSRMVAIPEPIALATANAVLLVLLATRRVPHHTPSSSYE